MKPIALIWALTLIPLVLLFAVEPPAEPTTDPEPAPAKTVPARVQVLVPDSAWTLNVEQVLYHQGRPWIVVRAARDPDVIGAQAISTHDLAVDLPDGSGIPGVLLVGATWNWDQDGVRRLSDEGLAALRAEAEILDTAPGPAHGSTTAPLPCDGPKVAPEVAPEAD